MSVRAMFIDHIVFIVRNIGETKDFYDAFLGEAEYQSENTLVYKVDDTKIFFVLPKSGFTVADRDAGGFNHLAFGVRALDELKGYERRLTNARIVHSGIKTDQYGNKDYIWFNDPNNIRIEIYCRPL